MKMIQHCYMRDSHFSVGPECKLWSMSWTKSNKQSYLSPWGMIFYSVAWSSRFLNGGIRNSVSFSGSSFRSSSFVSQ